MSSDWMALVALAACGQAGSTRSTGAPLSNERAMLIGHRYLKRGQVDNGTMADIICLAVKITPRYSTHMMW